MDYQLPLNIFLIMLIAFIINIVTRKTLKNIEKRQIRKGLDATQINFFANSIGFIIYSIAIFYVIYAIPSLRSLGGSLLAGAGILAAIIGFASQAAFSNIISGIFILIFKPFRIGDTLQVQGVEGGKVIDITFRHTIINSWENKRIIIPNSLIGNKILTNSTIEDDRIRKLIPFKVGFESDVESSLEIIEKIILEHPNVLDTRTLEEIKNNVKLVKVIVAAWGAIGVEIKAYVWTKNAGEAVLLQSDVLRKVKLEFEKKGIRIPVGLPNFK